MKPRLVIILGAILLVVILVLVFFMYLGGGGNNQPTNQKLTVWSPFDEGEVYAELAQPYIEANPGLEFEFKYIAAKDAKEYEAKVVDAIASGEGPDIWLLRNDWLAKHQSKLVSATNFVRWGENRKLSTKEDAISYFTKAIFEQNARGDEVYGYPLSFDSLALYANSSVFSQVRQELDENNDPNAELLSKKILTWSDVVAVSKLITKKDSKGNITRAGIAMGTVGNSHAPVDIYSALIRQYGGSIFTQDEKQVGLHLTSVIDNQNRAPGLEALNLFSSFGRNDNANYSWNVSLGDPEKAFVDGKLAMFIGYSSSITNLKKLNKEFVNYSVVPLPQVEDPEITGKRTDFAAYWTHGVSKSSDKPDLAWGLLRSLDIRAAKLYSSKTGKPSYDPGISQTLVNAGPEDNSLFALQIVNAPAIYKPDWQTVDEVIQDMLNQALLTNSSLQTAIDSAAERLKALLPENA